MVQSDNYRADFHYKSPRRVNVRCKVSGKTYFSVAHEDLDVLLALSNEVVPW